MSVYSIIVFVLMLSTKFTECNQYNKVIRHCLFVYTLVGVRSFTGRYGHLVPFENATNSRHLIRYCDTKRPTECDPFLNRIVAIVKHRHTRFGYSDPDFGSGEVITTGVFINRNHVLSSYNPFRNLMKQFKRGLMRVYFCRSAWTDSTHQGYVMGVESFGCARQVIPKLDHTDEQWHGPDHLHSPVHDLIVFKTMRKTLPNHGWTWVGLHDDKFIHVFPKKTKLAQPSDGLAEKLKFVSLGLIDDDHITNKNHLHTVQLNRQDRENCGEWFIRAWGRFICVKNVKDYIGIGSGAFLFSEGKVFGVGSFALKKGNDSILVFTDIRPYYKVIFQTCAAEDGHGDIYMGGIDTEPE